MIQEVKYVSDDTCLDKVKEVIGYRYNDPPIGLTEISDNEFANSLFFSYSPVYIDHKQILLPHSDGRNYYTSIKLFHFHDGTGIGIIRDSGTKKPRYYRYGCMHEYRSMSGHELREKKIPHFGECYHVEVCDKCGHINAYDSSD